METNPRPKFHLNILTYREGQDWIAHCAELNIMAVSQESSDAAFSEAIEACAQHLAYAIENHCLADALHYAPASVLAMLEKATPVGDPVIIQIPSEKDGHDRAEFVSMKAAA